MTRPQDTIDAATAREIARKRGTKYRKAKPVTAQPITDQEAWTTGTGEIMHGQPGDWALTDGESSWTVKDSIFRATYEPIQACPGLWRKVAVTILVPMNAAFTVETLEGNASGNAGDFLAVGDHDDAWPLSAAYVEQHYVPVDTADASPTGC